jgi:hypothetical protein
VFTYDQRLRFRYCQGTMTFGREPKRRFSPGDPAAGVVGDATVTSHPGGGP